MDQQKRILETDGQRPEGVDLQPLPLASLIQQAVSNCASAQQEALMSMLENIEEKAFVAGEQHQKALMISFVCDIDGVPHTIRLPLLTVVPMQFMQIDDVEINFNVAIHSNKKSYEVVLMPSRQSIRRTRSGDYDMTNNISVNIRAANIDMSSGMARLLQLASTNGVIVKPIGKP